MDHQTPIHARFAIPDYLRGDLITERVICSHHIQEHIPRPDSPSRVRQEHYRQQLCDHLKSLHPDPEQRYHDMAKLKWLLMSFISNKSLIFKESVSDLSALARKCSEVAGDKKAVNLTAFLNRGIVQDPRVQETLFHPLHVLVLAYFMGGPITTSYVVTLNTWRRQAASTGPDTADQRNLTNFYTEGDTGDIFEDHRITMVWEEGGEGGYVQNPQGVHHVFFTGDARPRAPPILEVSNMKLEENDACQVILFDSKNAALFYEPQDATAVRRSIAFDLYVNLHVPGFDDNVDAINEAACRTMTLGHLLTTTPIPGYNDRFHQLLFSPESIEAIFAKLAQLNIGPPPNTTPVATEDPNLKIKFQQWEAENIAKAATIFNAPLRLQGTYNNTLDFQDRLRARMLNDMRRSFLGLRFFPHKPRDGDKEPARIWIRDMGMTEIVLRVGQYFPIALPLHQPHLIPPHKLSLGGAAIYQNALELIANGYADADGLLYSVGTLAQALGDAFGAYKEIQHNPEPEINDNDLLIYQTRCLYLFWCADYVAGCMSRRVKSEFVKPKVAKAKKGAMGRDAHALLLNYVAWCLFVDELPPRPFHVRQPVDA